MTPLSQRDPKWGEITIGNSNSKIKDFGCTITSIAILAGTTPDVVNAYLTAVNGFSVDRIIWQKLNETKLGVTFPDGGRQYIYNDEAVRKAIEENFGCLVEVDYDGVVSTSSDRHWVLFIGDHKLIDPWDGKVKPTSSYPILKGYAILRQNDDKDDELTQQEENILRFLREQEADEGKVREAFGALTDKIALQAQIQTLNEKITGLEASQESLQKQIDDLSSKLLEDQKTLSDWQSDLLIAKNELENVLEQNILVDEERKKYKRLYENALEKFPSDYSWKDLFNLFIKKLKTYERKSKSSN